MTVRSLAAIAVAALIAGSVFAVQPASAQTPSANLPTVKPPDFSQVSGTGFDFFGSVTVMSDSRGQGFTSTEGDPAVQIDAGVIWTNYYFGVSGSNIDLGRRQLANGTFDDVGRYALTYYGGYVNRWNGIDWDVGISYATFPGADDGGAELDYWEGTFGVAKVLFRDLKGGLRIYYSPDYTADQGHNWVFEGSLEQPLPEFMGLKPVYSSVIGYQAGEEDRDNFDYWFFESGIEVGLSENFSLDFRYHRTADVPFDCNDLCDGRFVASAILEF